MPEFKEQQSAAVHFEDYLSRAIDAYAAENEITYALAIGTIEIIKSKLVQANQNSLTQNRESFAAGASEQAQTETVQ